MKSKTQKIIGYLIVAMPFLSYSIYWTLHPSYWFNGDPAAFYFLDSLSIFVGETYAYVDHPGTPIHVLGTLMLAITRPFFQETNTFIQYFIESPAAFFIMTNAFLLVSCIFTAVLFYHTAFTTLKHHRLAGAIALPTAYLILHPQSFQSITLWSHNSLNFPLGTLWLIWLYRELIQEKELKWNKLLLLGLTVGILATAHIYFFTWVACGILAIYLYTLQINRSYKQSFFSTLTFIAGTFAGIILMLIPVYKELPRFFAWLIEITTHTGMYGTGETGVVSSEIISIAIRFWWTSIPLAMILLITAVLASSWLTYQSKRSAIKIPPATSSMIIGLLFQIALLLILFTKAAVKLRYTLALAATLPVLLLLVINLFEVVNFKKAKWAGIVYALILVGMVFTFPQQLNLALERTYYEEQVQTAEAKVLQHLAVELGIPEDDIIVVLAYGTPLKCANMLIASDYSGHFKEEISEMCPNQYGIYDTHITLNPAQPLVDIREIAWDLVVWPGNGSDLPEYLESVNAVNIPSAWRVQRDAWYYIHSK